MEQKRGFDRSKVDDGIVEKVIKIDRINKVVKGGKRLAFRAFVIAGDQSGQVGLGLGKSKEVPSAIRKGVEKARKHLERINIVNGTIPHEVIGEYGAARVILKPARPGTGVIAGGAVRILLESLGLKNVVAKSLASRNPINCARAALVGLLQCKNIDQETALRGKPLSVFLGER
ncbi:30S ribosomal protein S5 [bacterium]|nr:30S ribosomal protein S5 [bacterium]